MHMTVAPQRKWEPAVHKQHFAKEDNFGVEVETLLLAHHRLASKHHRMTAGSADEYEEVLLADCSGCYAALVRAVSQRRRSAGEFLAAV